MIEETRVGYMSINILLDQTIDYIKAHTVKGLYVGKPEYLIKAYEMREYLKK